MPSKIKLGSTKADHRHPWKGLDSIYEFKVAEINVDSVVKSIMAFPTHSSNDILNIDCKL